MAVIRRAAWRYLVRFMTACIVCGKPGHGTRCPRHEREHMQRRGATGWDRQKANAAILAANPWCALCQMVRSVVVDHRRPLWQGGTDDPHNKQALCGPCHRAKTAREARQRNGGTRR